MAKSTAKRRVSSKASMAARATRVADKKTVKKASAKRVPVARQAAKTPPAREATGAPVLRDVNQKLKIKVLVEDNPRRDGTVPHEHWKKFVKDGVTVEDFLAKGGDWLHLRADIARGHVKLVT